MVPHRMTASAVALLVLASTENASAHSGGACWHEDEVTASRIKDLQTWMAVGVLKCGASFHNMAGNYNYFVVENRATLARHQDVLKARFVRQHGEDAGRRAYDGFTTTLANHHSSRADAPAATLCGDVDRAAKVAATMTADAENPASLEALLALGPQASPGVVEACGCSCPAGACACSRPAASAARAAHDPPMAGSSLPADAASITAGPAAPAADAAALQAATEALRSAIAALRAAQAQAPAGHEQPHRH
jgi:hypothetical protein